VFEGYVFKVEVYAFEQEVSSDECAFAAKIEDSGIVSDALLGGSLHVLNVFGQVLDESKLA
jgi:hypothetical protein